MSNEVRHLLFNRKGQSPPFELTPKRIKFFSSGVRGGSVQLLDLKEETPHCVRGDTPTESFRAQREISAVYVSLGEF